MHDIGWIKLYRQMQECCLWKSNEPFDHRSAWIDLLLSAMHKDKTLIIDGEVFVVKRGSYMTSISKLAERWGWSRGKAIRFLNVLETEHMANTKRTPKGTLVTIEKYGFFQGDNTVCSTTDGTTDGTTLDTTDGTTDGTQKKNIKNVKNEKNIKEKDSTKVESKKKRYVIPPPVEDVAAYCAERNNGIDAQAFLDFYQSRGWMMGKTKIKDWQATVRTWERKDREGNYGRARRNEKPAETDEYATEFYKQLGIE